MIKICVVDDQAIVRQGLCILLRLVDDFEIVAEASNGNEALECIESTAIDVMLLDLRMPVLSGLETLEKLKDNSRAPRTIILTTFDDKELVIRGLMLGAKGYLLKDVGLPDLTRAIRSVASGGRAINPTITDGVLRQASERSSENQTMGLEEPLSDREAEIVRMMAGGFNNREIGKALFIAEGTVKNHVSNVLGKLGARDRTQAVMKALELGILS